MKLFYLGLMGIALILVLLSISVNTREGFDFEGRKDEQRKYLKDNDKYWDSRLFPQVVKGVDKESKFVELSKDKTKLNEISPTASTDKREIAKKIEKCKAINLTGDCSEIEANECGYCWDTDKIIYGNADGPIADVCSKKNWIAPGPRTGYYCQKKKEQEICKKMTDCGDSTGEKSICAWCPLKGTGVPKKRGPQGGWVAKYPEDDACDWKSKLMGEYGECKDLKTKNPSQLPNNKWHDKDGKYWTCEVYGKNNKAGCKAWGSYYSYQQLSGQQACCVCGGGNTEIDFLDNLIDPKDCARFKQMFPCVGPNMLTGPHTDECLQSLWKKAGCTGDLKTRVSDASDYKNWNSHSYGAVGDNMKESIYKVAVSGSDYSKSEPAYKKCFGSDVNPCETRFKPRPQVCAQKLYNETGCSADGKLNPQNTPNWPDGYVGQGWKNGQEGGWSPNGYKSQVLSYKREMQSNLRNPKADFDRTIYTSMLCNGQMPDVPWDKPCWRDFNIIMMTLPGVSQNPSNMNLSFSGAPSSFKSLLTAGGKGWWKNEYAWVGNYEITKAKYDGKYFPFWNFISGARNWWNNNWGEFKTQLLKVPSVKPGSPSVYAKWKGWNFDVPNYRGKVPRGYGDCDVDADCGPGLKCAQDKTKISGLIDSGAITPNTWGGGRDFCYDPNDAQFSSGDGRDTLSFLSGSPFDNIVQTATSMSVANSKGYFLKLGNNRYLTKQAFMNENFPYWLFLRTASVN